MTHVLHRQLRHDYPAAVVGQRPHDSRRRREGIHRRLRRRGRVLPRPCASRRARRDARADRPARLCAYRLLHHRGRRGAGRPSWSRTRRRASARSISSPAARRRSRRRSRWRASISSRSGEPQRRHFIAPPAELSRQHARRARGRRQRVAARAVRAAADRDPSRLALLRLSRPARRRDARRPTAERAARRAGATRSDELGPARRHRLRRRDRGRRHRRRGAAGAGLFQAHPRDLRPARRAADPGRGDVRHGPHRHAATPASRRASRPTCMAIAKGLGGGYQPIGAVLVGEQDRTTRFADGSRLLPARPHLYRPSDRLRRGARRAAASSSATTCWPMCASRATQLARRLQRALRQSPACRRHPRPRPVPRRRAGRRPRAPRRRSIRRSSCTPAIKREAMARGLMVYPMGGTIDGVRGDHVLLAPPFIVDERHIDTHRRAARRGGRCGDRVAPDASRRMSSDKRQPASGRSNDGTR